jgi:Uma2 family endonuclease
MAFYDGDLWVDPDMEQIYFHNLLKLKVGVALVPLAEDKGIYGTDGVLLSNSNIGLSTVPDGYYVSDLAFETGRVREVEGKKHGCVELEGAPEMVLEIVSDSSEKKDMIDLRDQYWESGIDEYWLIDGRTDDPLFELLKRGPKGFVAVRRQAGGWAKSEVFGRTFRLVRKQSRRNRPDYTLEVK